MIYLSLAILAQAVALKPSLKAGPFFRTCAAAIGTSGSGASLWVFLLSTRKMAAPVAKRGRVEPKVEVLTPHADYTVEDLMAPPSVQVFYTKAQVDAEKLLDTLVEAEADASASKEEQELEEALAEYAFHQAAVEQEKVRLTAASQTSKRIAAFTKPKEEPVADDGLMIDTTGEQKKRRLGTPPRKPPRKLRAPPLLKKDVVADDGFVLDTTGEDIPGAIFVDEAVSKVSFIGPRDADLEEYHEALINGKPRAPEYKPPLSCAPWRQPEVEEEMPPLVVPEPLPMPSAPQIKFTLPRGQAPQIPCRCGVKGNFLADFCGRGVCGVCCKANDHILDDGTACEHKAREEEKQTRSRTDRGGRTPSKSWRSTSWSSESWSSTSWSSEARGSDSWSSDARGSDSWR